MATRNQHFLCIVALAAFLIAEFSLIQNANAQQCNVASDCPAQQCNTASCQCATGRCTYKNCVYTPMPNGTQCSDQLFCNGDETCQNGTCQTGIQVACTSDIGACTIGQCNESLGACEYIPNDSLCNDGISCTMDTCSGTVGCINDASACVGCILLDVSFGTGNAQNGEPVKITVTSIGCPDGETVDLELWESDSSNGSGIVPSLSLPSIVLNKGTGSIVWNAVWTNDTGDPQGFSDTPSDPEYFVKARLNSNPSQVISTQTNLVVTKNLPPNGNPGTYNFCPTPVGIRPCAAAVWKESPDCRWDTSQCSPNELNHACNPMEKRCNSNYLQECKVAAPALWENIKQCPNGCNEELLECNVLECIEGWKCTDWSPCTNNVETRLCNDDANCGTAKNKPVETMACSTAPACGDGTCSPQENSIFCPADCKIIKLPEASTENLVLLTLSLVIFGGFAIIVSQFLTTRQRI